ncbi:hypothetical protein SSBG_06137 [Streptomyces sp. SPB074]|nr:hypothetical protein SSBG_06137 [Streptomyces sp. SPB074]
MIGSRRPGGPASRGGSASPGEPAPRRGPAAHTRRSRGTRHRPGSHSSHVRRAPGRRSRSVRREGAA